MPCRQRTKQWANLEGVRRRVGRTNGRRTIANSQTFWRVKRGPPKNGKPQSARSQVGPREHRDQIVSSNSNVSAVATSPITLVGIGASAGGIEALGRFFDAMPADSGCAFVVVLHLDPTRESEMARILSARTTMPVAQVKDGMRIAPDHVYVIAPDTDLKVRDGELHVSKPSEPRGQRHPVDVLFSSIAAEQRERAIAIVLSGTGNNGTEGLKEIRAEGGMSLVQSPETAKFDGMPRSAIDAGMADHILAAGRDAGDGASLRPPRATSPLRSMSRPSPPRGEATVEQVLELSARRARA